MLHRLIPKLAVKAVLILAASLAGPEAFGADPVRPQKVAKAPTEKKESRAWTLEEALASLALQRRDPYLQYVALQLARRENRLEETAQKIQALNGNEGDRREVDLFSIFAGALAVQESLQLDTMRGRAPRSRRTRPAPTSAMTETRFKEATYSVVGKDGKEVTVTKEVPYTVTVVETGQGGRAAEDSKKRRRGEMVALAKLAGPAIKSHPWKKMLGSEKPEVGHLCRCVPEDFYFVEFRSLNKLVDALEEIGLWSTHLSNQALREARTQDTASRIETQLVLETTPALRPFYDAVVEEVAVTGSDLYLREGSDVTLILRFKQPELFKSHMDGSLTRAEKNRRDIRRSNGKYFDVDFVHLETPDREVCVYSAYPAPGLHVRSNSRVAFQKVLEAIRGKTPSSQRVRRLGDSAEFAYIRTLMRQGAEEEDGFIYLSDPFIRRQVGPQVKLSERRRMVCYNHLRMIGHAALLHRTEIGHWADCVEALAEVQCCPPFNAGNLRCPDGGTYSLSKDGTYGVCSRHSHAHFLTPCCEIPLEKVTGEEADEYLDFVEEYNQYWRTYFDPIAIRLQITPKRCRVETIVLPLIDNSIYKTLAEVLAGKPEPLDAQPIIGRNIFSLNLRFNKEYLLKELEKQLAGTQVNDLGRRFEYERGDGPEDALAWLALAPGAGFPAGLPWGGLASAGKISDPDLQDLADLKNLGIPEAESKKVRWSTIRKLLTQGLGNQVGLHVCDAPPLFDFNTSGYFGAVPSMINVYGLNPAEESALAAILYSSLLNFLNTPVYLSIPVQDAKVVDEFLESLDPLCAMLARTVQRGSVSLAYEFYKFHSKQDPRIVFRGNAIRFGPVKARFFSARIGDVFYVTSKPHTLLEDLVAAQKPARGKAETIKQPETSGPTGHAMIRVRPQNWNQVLTDYRLGWADSNREACLNNLGPLSSVARAYTASLGRLNDKELGALSPRICRRADQLHSARFFCPEGGTYRLATDGKTMTCSVHGSVLAPRQPTAPAERSSLGSLLNDFQGMTATLTFLEDGLHAVVMIERK